MQSGLGNGEDTAHEYVGMSMAGVVMVDCDPNNHGM
jgi:hypothetical protein